MSSRCGSPADVRCTDDAMVFRSTPETPMAPVNGAREAALEIARFRVGKTRGREHRGPASWSAPVSPATPLRRTASTMHVLVLCTAARLASLLLELIYMSCVWVTWPLSYFFS